MNRKGADPQSVIFVIVSLVAAGIILLLFSHLFSNIFQAIDDNFSDDSNFNNTDAHLALQDIQTTENSAWDYAFLGIFIAYFIGLLISGFSTRISPFFFWIYIILMIVGLFIGTILSNNWIQIAENPALSESIARFPIMNTILGEFYPIVVTVIIAFSAIVLFGKPSNQEGR